MKRLILLLALITFGSTWAQQTEPTNPISPTRYGTATEYMFCQSTPPASPTSGMQYLDCDDFKVYQYYNSTWTWILGGAGGGDDVSTFGEKSGDLVGSDRLYGLSGATDFAETISNIPLSIFIDDLTHSGATIATVGEINTGTDNAKVISPLGLAGSQLQTDVTANNAKITNTDAQDLTLTGNTLAVTGDPNTDVDLSGYLDNTNLDINTLAKLNAIVADATLADGAHTTDTTLTLIDDDTMATATASNVPSGESIKAYVDGVVPTISNSVLVTLVTTAETVTETNVEDGVLFHQTSGANTVTVDPMALTYSGDAWFLMFKNTSGSDMTIANGAGVTGASHVISSNDFLTLFSEADDVWQKYNGSVAGGSESTTVSDTAEIDLTLSGSDISGIIVASSIDETKLDASTNASLDLADSASQGAHTTNTDAQDLTLTGNTLAVSGDPNTDVDISTATAVSANTAKTGITAGQASDITTNNAKISYTDGAAVTANTAKVTDDDDGVAEVYGVGWDSDTDSPTKNDVYDKIETIAGGSESTTVSDTAEIDLTLTGSDITGIIITSSIDETKLDASVNASLDLADSSSQGAHTTDTNTQLSDAQVATAATNEGFVTGAHTTDTNLSIASVATINTGTNNTEAISPLGLAGSQLQTDVTANNAKVTNAFTAGDETKLDGIATGATVNDTDVNLKARANHTGTQTAATISDFDTEVSNNASVTANTAKISYTDAAAVSANTAKLTANTANVTTAGALMDSEVDADIQTMTIAASSTISGSNTGDQNLADTVAEITDLTATASEINTPLDGALVTLTEFQELETIGATVISAADWTAVSNLVGTNTGDEAAASTTVSGVIEVATGAETNTGTDATKAVSPDGLDDWTGSAQLVDSGITFREGLAISDNTTALTTGTKMTIYSPPYAITITDVEASLLTAATGAEFIVDIHDDGTTIMGTNKLDIEVSEFHTKDAATQPAISAGSIAANSKLEFIIDQVGSTVAGAGAVIYYYYTID